MKNFKIFAILTAMVLVVGSFFSALPVSAASERTTLTVGFDAEFPPYGYQNDEGEYVGFDLSLADEVCRRRGWELKKVPIEGDLKDMELDTGAIDCIWNGFTINGREND